MEKLSASIEKIVSDLEKGREKDGAQIYAQWPRIVGNLLARRCSPVDLKEGTLIVNVESPAWMYMLRLKNAQILRQLNKISKKDIQAIKLRLGKVYQYGSK